MLQLCTEVEEAPRRGARNFRKWPGWKLYRGVSPGGDVVSLPSTIRLTAELRVSPDTVKGMFADTAFSGLLHFTYHGCFTTKASILAQCHLSTNPAI